MGQWSEPIDGFRVYTTKDNSKMDGFIEYIPESVDVYCPGDPNCNLGIIYDSGYYRSTNQVGICRLKTKSGSTIKDESGNELLLRVIPRFPMNIPDLLNYISSDDEFDRYMAPQTISNLHKIKDFESGNDNSLFTFFIDEKPVLTNYDELSNDSIISVIMYLYMLDLLCHHPLKSDNVHSEDNLAGKIKGRVEFNKNLMKNTLTGRDDRFYCRFISHTTDIVENRILKAALIKCSNYLFSFYKGNGQAISSYSRLISLPNSVLRDVSPSVSGREINCAYRFSGCYAHYKPVIELAQQILRGRSSQSTSYGTMIGLTVPYRISMSLLFEVYVRAYLKHNGLLSYKEQIPGQPYMEKYDEKIDVFSGNIMVDSSKYIQGPIKPDIIIKIDDKVDAVVDVKYKDYTNSRDSRLDRLQILAYSMILNSSRLIHIFPGEEDKKFNPTKINSLEDRQIDYQQLVLKPTTSPKTDVSDCVRR